MTFTRLAPALALATALAACGHARQGSLVRSPVDDEGAAAPGEPTGGAPASAASEPPPGETSVAVPASAAAAEPPSPEAAPGAPPAGESAPATAPTGEPAIPPAAAATPVQVARAKPGAARGALGGAGVVLYVFGTVCMAGGWFTVIGCVALVYFEWPYVVATVAVGAVIGAAVGAEPRATPAARPPDPPPAAPNPDPLASWDNSRAACAAGAATCRTR